MKITYLILGVVLVASILFYLSSCGAKSSENETDSENEIENSKPKVHHTEDNAFEGLRSMAFSVSSDQLGLAANEQNTVYGVIMDWEMGGATASTVAYLTGDASLYLSSGGGVIGGGQHANVNSAAKEFVILAQSFLSKAAKTSETPLPETDMVKFYFLTDDGVYVGQESMLHFENNSSEWLDLFNSGNKVLTELRIVSENK